MFTHEAASAERVMIEGYRGFMGRYAVLVSLMDLQGSETPSATPTHMSRVPSRVGVLGFREFWILVSSPSSPATHSKPYPVLCTVDP